jgi:flagellar biosynthesis/type III secretory pathway chaperone
VATQKPGKDNATEGELIALLRTIPGEKEANMADEYYIRNQIEAPKAASRPDPGAKGLLDICILTAQRLASTLEEETEALRGFEATHLSEILPRKEALAIELNRGVKALSELPRESDNLGAPLALRVPTGSVQPWESRAGAEAVRRKENAPEPEARQENKRSELKLLLTEIEKRNKKNHIFIQGSLTYWQDLLNLFVPGTYAPAEQGLLRRRQPSTKGIALNREA